MDTTLIVTEGPASLKAWNALRLVAALISQDKKVMIFLLDDGVYLAKKEQKPVDKLSELAADRRLSDLMAMGAAVETCGVCIEHRGLLPSDLVDGVTVSTMVDLARSIANSQHVITL